MSVIGIDLGTTNSCAAVYENGKAKIVPAPGGARTAPSVVSIDKTGRRMVGAMAKRQQVLNPTATVSSVKRLMGRRYSELPEDLDSITVPVSKGDDDRVEIDLAGKIFAPEEISAQILNHLKEAAEKTVSDEIKDAVITVPAYFNDSQRQATKDAGHIAGLNVLRIINEPTAAALAYGFGNGDGPDQTILVFDLGGGTFDVSVLEIAEGSFFEVKATAGDNSLGGDDFDAAVVAWLLENVKDNSGIDLSVDKKALQALYEAAEKAKRELSELDETYIQIPFIAAGPDGPLNVEEVLTKAKFEDLVRPLVEKLSGPVTQALVDAEVDPSEIDEVLLVGGMTRVPVVRDLVEELIGRSANQSVNPDEAVAMGAAIQAGAITDEDSPVVLLDVIPLSLGLETKGGVMTKLIDRNTTIPARRTELFSTAEDNQPSVELHVLQGEREMVDGNRSLGKLHLLDIPPAQRGVPKVEVTFEVDADGILDVSAIDQATGNEIAQKIENGSGISSEEIEKMISDAKANIDSDRIEREKAQIRNQAETLAYQAERMIRDQGDKMTAESREVLATTSAEVREALSNKAEPEELQDLCERLVKSAHTAAAELYQKGEYQSDDQPEPAQSEEDFDEEPPVINVEIIDDEDE